MSDRCIACREFLTRAPTPWLCECCFNAVSRSAFAGSDYGKQLLRTGIQEVFQAALDQYRGELSQRAWDAAERIDAGLLAQTNDAPLVESYK